MIKCKGCNEQVDYIPLARVTVDTYFSAGPALTHNGKWCTWFTMTPGSQIRAYIESETAAYAAEIARVVPLPGLASK